MIRNVERKASFCEMFRVAQHDDESAGGPPAFAPTEQF